MEEFTPLKKALYLKNLINYTSQESPLHTQREIMDGSNPLTYGGRNPTMGIGIIPGKVFMHWEWIEQAQENAVDPLVRAECYPGAENDRNFDAMPGKLSMGLKYMRTYDVASGEPNELGIVTPAGLCTRGFSSKRSILGQFYPQGFVATPCRKSAHHMDANVYDPDQGYAIIRDGLTNTINNGDYVMTPGMPIMVTLDDIPKNLESGIPEWKLTPFDYSEFGLHYQDALAIVKTPSGAYGTGGISNLPFSTFFSTDGHNEAPSYSCDQEEAAGHFYSKAGIGLAFVETLARLGYITINPGQPVAGAENANASRQTMDLANAIGLWNESKEKTVMSTALAEMFFMDITSTDSTAQRGRIEGLLTEGNLRTVGLRPVVGNDPTANYIALRMNLSTFDSARIIGNWYAKTSMIVGKCVATAAPQHTLHIVAGTNAV